MRQLLANPELPAHIQQRARYELVVATLRGTNDFGPVDDVARTYFDKSLSETEPARLQDASALTLVREYCSSRKIEFAHTGPELGEWHVRLTRRIKELVNHETPHRRASLLDALGHLGLHPLLTEADIQDEGDEAHVPEHRESSW